MWLHLFFDSFFRLSFKFAFGFVFQAMKVRDRVFELTPKHKKDNQETENILKEEDAQVLLKDISEAV